MGKVHWFVIVLILVSLMVSGYSSLAGTGTYEQSTALKEEKEEIKVIVDTDAAPDDFSALMYLLSHPSISVIGIGISCGVSYVDRGVDNTLRLLEYCGINDIPVAAGKPTPLVSDHAFPTAWREGSNDSYGLDLPMTSLQPSSMNASELIIYTVENSNENVTIVALGPLTNIAAALNAQSSITSKIDKIHIMGGAVNVAGNVGSESGGAITNQVAEWNMWVDPHASEIVFKSGIPITMIGLDATSRVPVTVEFKERLGNIMTTPEAQLVYKLITPGLYFWDQLAAVSLTNPEVVTAEEHCIEIEVDLENHEGQTRSSSAGCANAMVAVNADAATFENLFIGGINDGLLSKSSTPGMGFIMTLAGLLALSLVVTRQRQIKK